MDTMKKFKAVIFDLDDTLYPEVDYVISGFMAISSEISKHYNLDATMVLYKMVNLFKLDRRNVFNRLLDSLNVKYSDDYITYLVDEYRNHMPQIKLYEDADYIIKYLYNKRIKLGIITDGYKIAQRNKIKALNIEKYFDCIIITDEWGKEYWKPHRRPYDVAKDMLGVEYEEMIYVGDNVIKDFVTPNILGMTTVLVFRKEGIYSGNKVKVEEIYKPNYCVSSLYEIEELIGGEF